MIFQTGGSRCKTGFSDLQNVATKLRRSTAVATKFCKDKLYPGTVPLTVELVSKALENMIRAYYILKLG
jgi:hypothetical protein